MDIQNANFVNQPLPRKMVIILDDSWLEALKHLTCPQWSKVSLVYRQVYRVIHRNLSRLPRQVIESAQIEQGQFWMRPGFSRGNVSLVDSLRMLYHPPSYVKKVEMSAAYQNLIDDISNGEERYIRCHSFNLRGVVCTVERLMTPETANLSAALKWLEQNVRADSISFPEWVNVAVHKSGTARAMLSSFVFGSSQKCKVQELVFTPRAYQFELLNGLIEDFLSLSIVEDTLVDQSSITTVVIDNYPKERQHRDPLGKNMIGREVDSQGARFLYEINSGEKRVRISFCNMAYWNDYGKAYLKFYTVR